MTTRRRRLRFQNRVLFLVLLAIAPGAAGTIVLLVAAGLTVSAPFLIGLMSVGLLEQSIAHVLPLGLGVAQGRK